MRCLRRLRFWSPLVWPVFLLIIPACISLEGAQQRKTIAIESAKQRTSSAQTARTLGIYDTHIKLDAIQELVILGFTAAAAIESQIETADRSLKYRAAHNAYHDKVNGVDDFDAKIAVLLRVAEIIYECGWTLSMDEDLSCNRELISSLFGRSISPVFYAFRHAFYCDGVIADKYFRNGDEEGQVYKLETIMLTHLNSKSSASGGRVFVRTVSDKINGEQRPIRPNLNKFCFLDW